ncbi:MAG: type II toxin-antitoxin system VapB family antitoxin [Candidatus Omnitrophica bacterium]|nr:type II toxin-antitoxin system VapB family antitoxin [Candidatus Omnitrophota bacterium]
MRTTIEVPDQLMQEALTVSKAKTKTMVIVLGLQELIHRHKLEELRALRGGVALTVDVRASRKRS